MYAAISRGDTSYFIFSRSLIFGCWPEHYDEKFAEKIPEDVMRAHVKEWSVVCPELIPVTVRFMDYSSLRKEDGKRIYLDDI